MNSDKPYLLVVVDGPSEARDDLPGAESPGVVRTIIQQVFGDEVAKNVTTRYWRHIRQSALRKTRGHVAKAHLIALNADETTVYGAVLLLDADRHGDTRLDELKEGTSASGVRDRTAIGIAREMVESWLLADASLRKHPLPSNKQCDDLWGANDDPMSNYPKHVLRRCVLEPRDWTHREAVEAFDPSRARSQSPSLHAFMVEVETLADRHYAR